VDFSFPPMFRNGEVVASAVEMEVILAGVSARQAASPTAKLQIALDHHPEIVDPCFNSGVADTLTGDERE
jgi:hypothetical protein